MGLVGMVLLHYISYDGSTSQKMLQDLSRVTNISSPSLSVAYYEPRILFYEHRDNPAYPQMQPLNRMDFIYAD